MTIDELIETLTQYKKNGVSGSTPVLVDTYDIPDGYRVVANVTMTARNMDDLPGNVLETTNEQYIPCISL